MRHWIRDVCLILGVIRDLHDLGYPPDTIDSLDIEEDDYQLLVGVESDDERYRSVPRIEELKRFTFNFQVNSIVVTGCIEDWGIWWKNPRPVVLVRRFASNEGTDPIVIRDAREIYDKIKGTLSEVPNAHVMEVLQ